MVIALSNHQTEDICPYCEIGYLRLEPEYKHEHVYDVYTCEVCESMVIDWQSIN